MTTSRPTGPDPAHLPAFPYQPAVTCAVLLGALLFICTRDLDLALQLPAGMLVVLFVQPLGQNVTRSLLGNRIDPAWIGMAGPIAGIVASYAAFGLYVPTGHGPLLAIALIGFCVSAIATLTVTPSTVSSRFWWALVGVSAGGALIGIASPWGLAVLLVVIGRLAFQLHMATRERLEAEASSGDDTWAGVLTPAAVLLALVLGVVLCGIALHGAV
jgi:hypothetical protein